MGRSSKATSRDIRPTIQGLSQSQLLHRRRRRACPAHTNGRCSYFPDSHHLSQRCKAKRHVRCKPRGSQHAHPNGRLCIMIMIEQQQKERSAVWSNPSNHLTRPPPSYSLSPLFPFWPVSYSFVTLYEHIWLAPSTIGSTTHDHDDNPAGGIPSKKPK